MRMRRIVTAIRHLLLLTALLASVRALPVLERLRQHTQLAQCWGSVERAPRWVYERDFGLLPFGACLLQAALRSRRAPAL
jgi:hypothetical protein